jgi:folate-binding protein YgfZ
VVFDLSHRGHLECIGKDRHKFLNGFCTQDILRLNPGQGCEAFLPNIKGKVLAHVFAFAGEDSIWLETAYESVQPIMGHLAKYIITEDVDFLPKSNELGELYLHGPLASEKLDALKVVVSDLPLYDHADRIIGKTDVNIRRVDWLGSPGYLLCMKHWDLSACWKTILEADVRPAGIAVFHALRIQAGFPLYGIDITEDNLAQEVARTEKAINFKKGCYLGQEPIARIDALGHVNQELRTIKLSNALVPTPGEVVMDKEQKPIGHVTSYAMLPDEYVPVALAYLHRNHFTPGTEVFVHCDEDAVPAKVL